MPRSSQLWLLTVVLAFLASGAREASCADRTEALPGELKGVGITEKLDAQVPLDLAFKDEHDQVMKLSDFFDGKKPVLLTLNYSSCPMLCNLQLNGLVDGLMGASLTAGKDFHIVTVSLDPNETTERSVNSKKKYVMQYGREGSNAGWHFLTGTEANIKALADSVGFGYRYMPDRNEYLHAAAFMLLTPAGRVSRYLYGVKFDSQMLQMSLVDTADGKIGSAMDQIILFCFKYDPETGKYGLAALRLMQGAGLLTVITLACVLGVFWRREVRRTASGIDRGTTA
jgi:protein SCO1/2